MNALPDYWTILWTALTTLGAAYFTYWLTGKSRLIVFSPNSTGFELKPPEEGAQPIIIRAGQVMVQNTGRKSANLVQVVAHAGIPMGYNLVPNADHQIKTGPRGEWILELPFIGPNETFTLQILNGPNIESVRSQEGPAKVVPVVHQRIYPRWLNNIALALMIVGCVTLAYGAYALIIWISMLPSAPN